MKGRNGNPITADDSKPGANLRAASLVGASLVGANLVGADLEGATGVH